MRCADNFIGAKDMTKSYRKIATRLFENTYEVCAFATSANQRFFLRSQLNHLACFLGIQPPIVDISALSRMVQFIDEFSLDVSDMYVKNCTMFDGKTQYVLANMRNKSHKLLFLVNQESDISVDFRLPTTKYMYQAS